MGSSLSSACFPRFAVPVALLSLVVLAPSSDLGAQVLISEIQASNSGTLIDSDGDSSDWLELFNAGDAGVDLDGGYLTDDPTNPLKWRIPALVLGAGAFRVVFCSGKDRRDPEDELHTNFRLEANGEYLALIAPDLRTILDEYAPSFPPQRRGGSYGIVQDVERFPFVEAGADARVFVPSDDSLALAWTEADFDDAAWFEGQVAVGFDAGESGALPPDEQVNIAGDGTATQSTLGFGGNPERAIDGNRNGVFGGGSVTHTATGDPTPWWQLELPEARPIARVVLWNRTDCCVNRLSNFRVTLRGPDDELVFDAEFFPQGDQSPSPSLEISIPPGTVAQTVRIELLGPNADGELYLSLAEVEVYDGGGLGFGPLIETDLEAAMLGARSSVYVRIPFLVEDPSALEALTLSMQFDDGFAAWINGQEVARRNAPAAVVWNSRATTEQPDEAALTAEEFNLAAHLGALRAGGNVLAIQGLNRSSTDDDLLVLPRLWGRSVLGERRRYLLSPTPGAPNESESVDGFVADTVFDQDRGFYEEPFDVAISTETEGAEIRYTLDGSAPTLDDGELYDGPIHIDTTTTLRAAAFRAGFGPTNVDTHTYIFAADVVLQTGEGFPGSWGGTAADYEMDPNVVDHEDYRDTIVADLQTIPTLSIVMDRDDLFGPRGLYSNTGGRGIAWERPASIEIIYPEGWEGPDDGRGYQEDCGIRIFGFGWRAHSASLKHAFRLLFKDEYGPVKLEYPFFPGWVERGRDTGSYDNIVLRSQGSRSWNDFRPSIEGTQYIRDAFARYSARDMGKVTTPSTYVHLYLDGLYWGLYNPVQRPDAKFLEDRYAPSEEEYDALNARVGNVEVIDGDVGDWNRLLSLVRGDVASPEVYASVNELLDVPDLIDYMLINFYGANRDWVGSNGNNMRVAGAPSIGGFKCFCWDMEYSIWNAGDNVLNVRSDQNTPSTVYSRLRGNEEFRVLFGDHAHRHLTGDGALSPEKTTERFLDRSLEIDRAIVGESARWGDRRREPPYTRDIEWVRERDRLLSSYFPQRSGILLNQLRAAGMYPNLEAPLLSQGGGFVEPGFELRISATDGAVLYTLDGSDPRLPGGEVSPDALEGGESERTPLLVSGAPVRAFVPSDDSLGLDWTEPDFDDSTWSAGTTGVGYEGASGFEDLIGLDVEAEMDEVSASIYVRVEFDVPDPAMIAVLELDMKYDDGFIAFLNGQVVASANDPDEPEWNSRATGSHRDSDAVRFETFDITEGLPLLRPGRNVLAIHGLNVRSTSNDFLILPEIVVALVTDDRGDIPIDESTRVRARAFDGEAWSALEETVFWIDTPVRITEIHYQPAPSEIDGLERNDLEFIELQNIGPEPIDLAGVRIEGGIRFDFTDSAVVRLEPGEIVVVVENIVGFASRYDIGAILVAGEYAGRLDDSGEAIRLRGPLDAPLLDFEYDDDWHPETDGAGRSLVCIDPSADRETWGLPESWRPSAFEHGSPGVAEGDIDLGGGQIPGDMNQDGNLDLSDPVGLLGHLFGGAPATLPCDSEDPQSGGGVTLMDVNSDREVNLSDAVHVLVYLFQGGPEPALGTECLRIVGCDDVCAP